MASLTTLIEYLHSPIIDSVIGLVVICLVLLVWVIRLERKMSKMLVGKSENIEQSMQVLRKDHQEMQKFADEMQKYLTTVESRLRRSVQNVETVRFNAFDGAGANQSFATAFINEEGDGVVVSSLYARDRTSVFSKPIKAHISEFELSDEEKKAIEQARTKNKNPHGNKKNTNQ